VIKSRRMRLAWHITHLREMINTCKVLVGKPGGGDHLEDLGVDGRLILIWILGNIVWGCVLDSSGSGLQSLSLTSKFAVRNLSEILLEGKQPIVNAKPLNTYESVNTFGN
jgi:hypothetical protein